MKGTPDQTGRVLPRCVLYLCSLSSFSESPDCLGTQQPPRSTARTGRAGARSAPSPTCHGEAGPVALAGFTAVFVLGDAAVGGEGVLLLHVGDVEPAVVSNKKPVFWRHNRVTIRYSPGRSYHQKPLGPAAPPFSQPRHPFKCTRFRVRQKDSGLRSQTETWAPDGLAHLLAV